MEGNALFNWHCRPPVTGKGLGERLSALNVSLFPIID